VPQPSYLGAQRLELHGDWLFIYGELEESRGSPDVRYNRRTHELRYAENHRDCDQTLPQCLNGRE